MSAPPFAALLLIASLAQAQAQAQPFLVRDELAYVEALARDGYFDLARQRLARLRSPNEAPTAAFSVTASRLARIQAQGAPLPRRLALLRWASAELAAALTRPATGGDEIIEAVRLERVEVEHALARALLERSGDAATRDEALAALQEARRQLEAIAVARTKRVEATAAALPLRPRPDADDAASQRLRRARIDAWLPVLDQAQLCLEEAELLEADEARRTTRLRSARELADQFRAKIGVESLRTLDARLVGGLAALGLGDHDGGVARLRELVTGDDGVIAALDAWPDLADASATELRGIGERALRAVVRALDEAGRPADALAVEPLLESLVAATADRGEAATLARLELAHARAATGVPGGLALLGQAASSAPPAIRQRAAELASDLVETPALQDAVHRLSSATWTAIARVRLARGDAAGAATAADHAIATARQEDAGQRDASLAAAAQASFDALVVARASTKGEPSDAERAETSSRLDQLRELGARGPAFLLAADEFRAATKSSAAPPIADERAARFNSIEATLRAIGRDDPDWRRAQLLRARCVRELVALGKVPHVDALALLDAAVADAPADATADPSRAELDARVELEAELDRAELLTTMQRAEEARAAWRAAAIALGGELEEGPAGDLEIPGVGERSDAAAIWTRLATEKPPEDRKLEPARCEAVFYSIWCLLPDDVDAARRRLEAFQHELVEPLWRRRFDELRARLR